MLDERALPLEVLQLGRDVGPSAFGLGDFQLRGDTAARAGAHVGKGVFAGRHGFARDDDLRVERPQREIRLRGEALERERDDVPGVARGEHLRAHRFDAAAQASPEIKLERGREREAHVVARRRNPGGRRQDHSGAGAGAVCVAPQIDLGQEGGVSRAQVGVGLFDARYREPDVRVALDSGRDELVERSVAVELPPVRTRECRRSDIGFRVGLGQIHCRPLVVGPEHAAAKQQHAGKNRNAHAHAPLSAACAAFSAWRALRRVRRM